MVPFSAQELRKEAGRINELITGKRVSAI